MLRQCHSVTYLFGVSVSHSFVRIAKLFASLVVRDELVFNRNMYASSQLLFHDLMSVSPSILSKCSGF